MSNEHNIVPLTFPGSGEKVRVVWLDDQPHWVVLDICRELGIEKPRNAVTRLEEGYARTTGLTDALGRERETYVVGEPGLYQLVFMSRKPQAAIFRKWIFEDVIPTIRRTGSYQSAEHRKAEVLRLLEAGDELFRETENAKQAGTIPAHFAQLLANNMWLYAEALGFPAVLITSGEIDDENQIESWHGQRKMHGQRRSAMYKKRYGHLPFKAATMRKGQPRIVNQYPRFQTKVIDGFHDKHPSPKAIDK